MQDTDKPAATGDLPGSPDGGSIADAPTPDAQSAFLAETSAHSRSAKRGWIIAGVIVAVLAVAGIAWALLPHPESDTSDSITSQPSHAGVPASSTASVNKRIRSGAKSSASSSATTPGAKSNTQPSAPGAVAAVGAKLTEIAAPPERTIGMIVVPKGFTPATYAVTFQPYGWGPGGDKAGRLIIKVSASKPTNASATKLDRDFAGRNVVVWATPDVVAGIKTGGTYQGVLQVRPQGDVGVVYLMSSKKVK